MGAGVRLGVIGLGNIGQQHLGHIRSGAVQGCEVTALCARQPSVLAAETGATQFADYREMIDSGLVDAVLVATPTQSHRDIGMYALERGLHVLMEKPLGLSVGQAAEMVDTAGDQVFALMLNQRLDPVFVDMKTLLDEERLGPIQRTSWTMTNWFRPEVYFQVSDWRATWVGEGGGLLLNQCIHNLDIFQWLCGMPVRVNGFCGFGRYHDIEVEDEATAYFEYTSGATGTFVGSTGEVPGVNRLDIVGDLGMLSYDGERLLHTRNEPGTVAYNGSTRDMFGQPETVTQDITPKGGVNQHALVIQNFVNAVTSGEDLIAPAAEGLHSLSLANAILLSSWEGAAVEMPLDPVHYEHALAHRLASSSLREKADLEVNVDMDKSYR